MFFLQHKRAMKDIFTFLTLYDSRATQLKSQLKLKVERYIFYHYHLITLTIMMITTKHVLVKYIQDCCLLTKNKLNNNQF